MNFPRVAILRMHICIVGGGSADAVYETRSAFYRNTHSIQGLERKIELRATFYLKSYTVADLVCAQRVESLFSSALLIVR